MSAPAVAREAAAPIDATWFIGGPIDVSAFNPTATISKPPTTMMIPFRNPGGEVAEIIMARLLPNVLVRMSQAAETADGKLLVPAGMQLVQLARTEVPTFCRYFGSVCLLDVDRDGNFDSYVPAKIGDLQPLALQVPLTKPAPLRAAVSYTDIPRTDCTCKLELHLVSLGSNRTGSSGFSFQLFVFDGTRNGASKWFSFKRAPLPTDISVLGARLTNLSDTGKGLSFTLEKGFDQRPFDIRYEQRWLQW